MLIPQNGAKMQIKIKPTPRSPFLLKRDETIQREKLASPLPVSISVLFHQGLRGGRAFERAILLHIIIM
jgi:hypothetical protein